MNIQRRFLWSLFTSCVVVVGLQLSTSAQDSGAAKVYRTQFIETRAKVKNILDRVDMLTRGAADNQTKQNLREEILALTKLIHRLDEEAGQSDIDAMNRGRESNKTLLLVNQGCMAMDYLLKALDSYLETNDRAFLSFAKDGSKLIDSVEKIL